MSKDSFTTNTINLRGQVAIVTGGGRGIGRAIALELASAGAAVAIFARSSDELAETRRLIEQLGGCAVACSLDVTIPEKVQAAVTKVTQSLGPIDLLVNNAGTLGPLGPIGRVDVGEWWRAMEVNVRGALLCAHFVLASMISRGQGRIINITSGAGAIPFSYLSSYVTSKTALARMTECMAAELKPHGIFAFALAPGTVRTTMSEYSLNSEEGRRWLPWFPSIFDDGLDVPPERPAQFVLALASGKADALSGKFISISDDLDALLRGVERIEEDQLHSLRVKRLSVQAGTGVKLDSIRLNAEQPGMVLRMEHSFHASREQIFDTWTSAEEAAVWFLPEQGASWIDPPQLEPKPDGRLRFHLTSVGKEFDLYGRYQELVRPEKLVFSWQWEKLPIFEGAGNTVVSLEFFSEASGTRLQLTQEPFMTQAALEAHRRGWQRCFDAMNRLMAAPAASSTK